MSWRELETNPKETYVNWQFALAVAASVLAVLAMPASAGTAHVSGIGVFNDLCQPPVGSPPDDLGDYPPIDLTGSLHGCWYTYVTSSKFNRSGTYQEKGTEIFVGCLNGPCGTFETTYTFTAKYVDDTFAEEIHGRCHHPIVGGTGGFAGAKGVINFKDDVVPPPSSTSRDTSASSELLASRARNDCAVRALLMRLVERHGLRGAARVPLPPSRTPVPRRGFSFRAGQSRSLYAENTPPI